MQKATLKRDLRNEYGTFGILTLEDGRTYSTVELPWKDNAPNASCIPPGEYVCRIRNTQVNKTAGLDVAYELQTVLNRDNIEIHVANYPKDVKGCIGLGISRAYVAGFPMVTNSRAAIQDFYARMRGEDFILVIE